LELACDKDVDTDSWQQASVRMVGRLISEKPCRSVF